MTYVLGIIALAAMLPTLVVGEMTVEAERLEIDRVANTATFVGSVVVKEDDLTLTSARLVGSRRGEHTVLIATGRVVVMRGVGADIETAKGDRAEYQPKLGVLVMTGKVTLSQGGNTLQGDRLEYDVKAGKARLTSEQRVRATLTDEDNQ